MIEIYLLTGCSGAGKTTAQYVFEELGYYVMDNIFPPAVEPTLDYLDLNPGNMDKFCFVTIPSFTEETIKIIRCWIEKHHGTDVLFKVITLNCNETILIKRFKLTRHVHPVSSHEKISLIEAIKQDRIAIDKLSPLADYRIDTSDMSALNLRKTLFSILTNKEKDTVSLCFMSFGHKHSIPLDVDLVLDTRALPNPYWIEELREYSGLDKPVRDYLESHEITHKTLDAMIKYLDFYIEQVQADGRGNYTIGICCSGGKHRSVYFADMLAKHYAKKYNVITIHRDIDKE